MLQTAGNERLNAEIVGVTRLCDRGYIPAAHPLRLNVNVYILSSLCKGSHSTPRVSEPLHWAEASQPSPACTHTLANRSASIFLLTVRYMLQLSSTHGVAGSNLTGNEVMEAQE